MTKEEAVALAGGNASVLARLLGCTPQAIYQWPDPIPKVRQYEIRDLVDEGKLPVEDAR